MRLRGIILTYHGFCVHVCGIFHLGNGQTLLSKTVNYSDNGVTPSVGASVGRSVGRSVGVGVSVGGVLEWKK